jgi:uncharacterized membrane protein
MRLLLTLHIVAAIFLVGPVIASGMTGLRALRTNDAAGARVVGRMTQVYGWSSLAVALLGAAMVQGRDHGWHFTYGQNWIRVSVLLYLVALVLSVAVVSPTFNRAARIIEAGEPTGRVRLQATISAGSVSSLYLAIIVLMVYRP